MRVHEQEYDIAQRMLDRALQLDPAIRGAAAFRQLLASRRLKPGTPTALILAV